MGRNLCVKWSGRRSPQPLSGRFQRLIVIAFWGAALFAFVMALLPNPPQLPGQPSDKIQHVIAFAVLAALASAGYPRTSLVKLGVLLSLFGAAIELFQLIPPLHREGSAIDWLADTVAVAAILLLVALFRRRSSSPRPG